jgi:hypothetical protein
MRPAHLIRVLDREFTSTREGHHTPVMLWGPPGVGKSQMVAQIATRHQVPVIDIRLSQMEPSDLRGIPFRVDERVEWAVPAILPNAERHGETGILFLDEINAAPPAVSAAAYQLILDRRLGEYQVPEHWAIFAAGNRQGDRGVIYSMPAPLANRFSHFEVETNLDDWVTWAYANGIDERVIGFLRFRPELLFDFDPAHNPVAFPSPRSWEFAHRGLASSKTIRICSRGPCRDASARRRESSCTPSSTAWTRCPTWMLSWPARRSPSRRRSTCSTPSPPPSWDVPSDPSRRPTPSV